MNVVTVRLADVEVEAVLRALDRERAVLTDELRWTPEIDPLRVGCPCTPCLNLTEGRKRRRASLETSLRTVDGAIQALEAVGT